MHEDIDHDQTPDPEDLVNVDKLPPTLRTLCRVLGHKAAFDLCKQRGGVPLWIPKSVTPDHHLVALLGPRGLAALVEALGGEVIEVPKYDRVAMQMRHQTVHGLLAQGLGPTRTALASGYTKRQVQNIQNDLLAAQGLAYSQPSLFGDDDQVEEPAKTGVDDEHKAAAMAWGQAHNPFGISK